jgi:uncharacterized protein (TIGR03437 family)
VNFWTATLLFAGAVSASAADYTTYIGDTNEYHVTAIAADADGNTYVTGSRSPASDTFVAKLDATGNPTLLTTLSATGTVSASGIAVDSSANIYIVGATTATDFPLRNPLQSISAPRGTGFLVKLGPDGKRLYSTLLGGTSGASDLYAVPVDSTGNMYVTGWTSASDYPHTPGLPAGVVASEEISPISGAFFAKISPAGDKVLYAGVISTTAHACGSGSTCFLSPISTSGVSITVDTTGAAYIAGNTSGGGVTGTPGALRTNGIGAFIAKVSPAGTALVYLTLLGAANHIPLAPGSNPGTLVHAITADSAGNAYIAGATSDPDFPATAGAFQTKLSVDSQPSNFFAPPSDAFVAKLNPAGAAMVWATFLGGSGSDSAQTVAVDSTGSVWTSGATKSTDFATSSGWPGGAEFIAELTPSGSGLSYAARFPMASIATALALDAKGAIHAAGSTGLVTTFMPGSAPGLTPAPRLFAVANAAGGLPAGRIAPGELISIYGLNLGPEVPVSAQFDDAGFLPTSLAGAQVFINGIAAPMLYVSGTRIDVVSPVELVSSTVTSLSLTLNDVALPDFRVVIDSASPQVFHNSDGVAAVNQDGSVNSQSNPAPTGSYVSIWATGTGFFPGPNGQIASSVQPYCQCEIRMFNNQTAPVFYAGAAPGLVNGIVQIDFQVAPAFAGSGSYQLTVNGKNSFSFLVFVAP